MGGRKCTLYELTTQRYPGIEKKELFARILCGEVLVNGERLREPRRLVSRESNLAFKPQKRFVSRAGEKMDAVLNAWQIDIQGLVMIDAGSSSGGFTDCLLKRGARQVYAVDVGYNQLDYRLRQDRRVAVLERTNIFSVDLNSFKTGPVPDAAVADLSFRSIRKAAAHLLNIVRQGWLIALIKPQFERVEPDENFRGIVPEAHLPEILTTLIEDLWREGAYASKLTASPIRGRKGNREFFALLTAEKKAFKRNILAALKGILMIF